MLQVQEWYIFLLIRTEEDDQSDWGTYKLPVSLKRLNLRFLERRRLRGDSIKVFKWFKGISKSDWNDVHILSTKYRTRSALSHRHAVPPSASQRNMKICRFGGSRSWYLAWFALICDYWQPHASRRSSIIIGTYMEAYINIYRYVDMERSRENDNM